jgi:cobalt-zinc-cadmium efflux system membrane fusion protein
MKVLRYFTAFLIVSYVSFMCSDKTEEHSHDDREQLTHAVQTHEHEQDQEHEDKLLDHEHDTEGFVTVEGEWEELIGLETAPAREMPIELLISVPGQIIPNQNQVALISPFIESSINCVFVNIGDRIQEGDLLVCLTSPEIGILRAEYDKAKAELEIAKQNYERRQKLFEENIISEKSYQETDLERKVAEVNYDYAAKKLLAVGIKEDELDNPPTGHSDAVGSTLHVHAPISGVVTARNASIGQKVDQSIRLFEIINLENVWLEADIFEKDLSRIKLGQKVRVRVSAYADEVFSGKIFYIGSTLNRETKTIKILVEIDNRSEKLKPGMFANTHIVVGDKKNTLVIPKEAVLEDEHLNIVFVKEEEAYHRHVVQLGIVSDMFVEILSGLRLGDTVVTNGNYQLKSKLKMAGIDPHAGHQH